MKTLCRFCAKKFPHLENLFADIKMPSTATKNPSSMVQEMFCDIQFTVDDDFPKCVCRECLDKLEYSFNFYQIIKKSQFKFKEILKQQKNCHNKSQKILLPKENCSDFLNESTKQIDVLSKPKRVYKCFECLQMFNAARKLNEHLTKTHTNENICKFCHCSQHDEVKASLHLITEHPQLKFFCRLCNQNFNTQRTFFRHFKNIHNTLNGIFFCSQCNFTEYSDRLKLLKHLNEQHANDFQELHDKNKFKTILPETTVVSAPPDELVMDVEFLDDFFLNQDENSFQFNDCWEALGLNFDDELKYDLSNDSFAIQQANSKINNCYKCPRCNHEFPTQIKMFLHLAHVHNENVLVCNDCGLKFNKISEYNKHNSMHFKENFICPNSEKNTDPIERETKEEITYQCRKCKRNYKNRNNFYIHNCCKFSPVTPSNAIQCNLCMLTFSNIQEMYAHQRNEHLNKTLSCSLCDKNFKTLPGLKYHLKTHEGIKSLICPYCKRSFLSNINLSAHIKAVHAIKKSHLCTLCDRRFSTLDHLKKHVMSVHQKERNHLCKICGSCFSQVSHLKQHIEIHKVNKKIQCEICLLGFTRRIDLRKHFNKEHY